MLTIYGTMLCPDCVECADAFRNAGISFTFREFSEDLPALKEFLKLRDGSPAFDPVREAGGIGIPCVVREDGSFTLDWQSLLTP